MATGQGGGAYRRSRPSLFDADRPFDLNAYMLSTQNDTPNSPSAAAAYAAPSPSSFSITTSASANHPAEPSHIPIAQRPRPTSSSQAAHDHFHGSARETMQRHNHHHHHPSAADDPPSWAELKTKAGKDRKRLPLACIACRRKKIRCSGEKPACKHCLKSRLPCVYKVTTRKAAPRTDYMAMLDKRLKRMEDRVIKIIPKNADKPNIPRAIVKPDAARQARTTGARKRSAAEAFGPQLEAWVESSAPGDAATALGANARATLKQSEQDSRELLTEGQAKLPAKEIVDHLVEVYFDYVYGQSYTLLHKPSFLRSYSSGNAPPVLLLAICAISARFSDHPSLRAEPALLRGDEWAEAAQELALKRYDQPSVVLIIVFILLGLHGFGACQGGRSWMLCGMAHRMAYALQLHKDLDFDPIAMASGKRVSFSFTDREIRRRTMWACFLMDRFNSSGTDRPLFADEGNMHLPLPIREDMFQMEIPGDTELLDQLPNGFGADSPKRREEDGDEARAERALNMGVSAYFVRAIVCWGQWVKYLNLGGRLRDEHSFDIWHRDSGWNKLWRELQDFIASLPDNLQYTQRNVQTHAAERTANIFLLLHIALNQITLFANRFSYPAIATIRPPKECPREFVVQGQRFALQAATNISTIIADAAEHRLTAPITGYAAYMSGCVHMHGIFSGDRRLSESSQLHLTTVIKFLARMKAYWSMFNFLLQHLKELYKKYASLGSNAEFAAAELKLESGKPVQYGDWYDKFPAGVHKGSTEDVSAADAGGGGHGESSSLSQSNDLQSVEEFFATQSRSPGNTTAKSPNGKRKRTKTAGSGARQDAKKQSPVKTHANDVRPMPARAAKLDHFSPQTPQFSQTTQSPTYDQPTLQQPQSQAQLFPAAASLSPPPLASSQHFVRPPYLHPGGSMMGPFHNGFGDVPDDVWNMNIAGLGETDWLSSGEPTTAWYMPFNITMPAEFNAMSGELASTPFDVGGWPLDNGAFLGMDSVAAGVALNEGARDNGFDARDQRSTSGTGG